MKLVDTGKETAKYLKDYLDEKGMNVEDNKQNENEFNFTDLDEKYESKVSEILNGDSQDRKIVLNKVNISV